MKSFNDKLPCVMVIFGGTGDLTHKKLMPALYHLAKDQLLPNSFHIVSVGRRNKTNTGYAKEVFQSIQESIGGKPDVKAWKLLQERIRYHRQSFDSRQGYQLLKELLKDMAGECSVLYYLAVSPNYFETIIANIGDLGMAKRKEVWRRIVIEKPFGRDLTTAEYLNQKISKVFPEENIYRIDHYLGKAMLQNLIVIRFANAVFEPVWNRNYIDNIQISACETVGIGTRGGYYEKFGALRDMVQNHLLQLLMLTAMEPPKSFSETHIREAKLEVLQLLANVNTNTETVRGQYGEGIMRGERVFEYRQEDRVDDNSNTETFIAMKLDINNARWQGVPFYIRTGKRMPAKSAEVVIQFKKLPIMQQFQNSEEYEPNRLVIKIQPKEGVTFAFNAKTPGTVSNIVPVSMDFCQNCEIGINSPEAYERLLYDVIRDDATLFPNWQEIKYSWMFADRVTQCWHEESASFPNYEAGTWGPKAADDLLTKDGRKWWNEGHSV